MPIGVVGRGLDKAPMAIDEDCRGADTDEGKCDRHNGNFWKFWENEIKYYGPIRIFDQ